MSTKFFTNSQENSLINKFEGIFANNPNIQHFDILVGYLRASGYFQIQAFTDKVAKLRILVGIDVDTLLAETQAKGLELFANSQNATQGFLEQLKDDIAQADYDKTTDQSILEFIQDVASKKIEVKAHPSKKIHAKVYIFRPENFNQHTPAQVITGSSNLTSAGLGTGEKYNYEFNVQLNDYEEVAFATEEFEKLWQEAVAITPKDVTPIKETSYLNDTLTPFEIYLKLLIEYFGKSLEYDAEDLGDLPENYKKLSYQQDAVKDGYDMLLKHNGFMLADVVGLGKTVIAAQIARKFLLENGMSKTRILVVYPPAVEKNWKTTFGLLGIDKYTHFISNGSLKKILDGHEDYKDKGEYDLVIVDEAHKFRTHSTQSFNNLQLICKSPRQNQDKGKVKGSQKKVILVSATPLNNKPEDIFSQIQMFQDVRNSSLPITNLTGFFSPLIETFKNLKKGEELDVESLRKIYSDIRKNVIEPITIRRTRTDLLGIERYKQDLASQGIKFPDVLPPKKVEYALSPELNNLFFKTIIHLVGFSGNPEKLQQELELVAKLGLDAEDILNYARYQAIAGLKPKIQEQFYSNAERASKSLATIMKTMLVKRLESSFEAFKKSLATFEKATSRMIEMFEKDKVYIAPDLDINKLLDQGMSEEDIDALLEKLSEENPKNQIFSADDFDPEFLESLKHDEKILKALLEAWQQVDKDPKCDEFLKKLDTVFFHKDKNLEQKLVIFSESKDTIDYLKTKLEQKKKLKDKVLAISSKNRKDLFETILENFDANQAQDKQKNDYTIILTTEVLAEGVNLHRSNVIVHYDTPWNSTKLMQRIGRVNRIGTQAPAIYNYVFYPSAQGDSQIKLSKTALMKIQAFHTAFGEDNQVYSEEEILDEVSLFTESALQEQADERLKYREFLREYKKQHEEEFKRIEKIPLKSRVGRGAEAAQKQERQDGTAVFLKSSKKFEFYWVNTEGQADAIPLVEAFKIFEAEASEKPQQLIPSHHAHVKAAIANFSHEMQKAQAQDKTPEALGGVAQKAKQFLKSFVLHPKVASEQKANIHNMISLIDIGKYANLHTEVSKLAKKKLNLISSMQELDKIADKYGVEKLEEPQEQQKADKLTLILSESFQ